MTDNRNQKADTFVGVSELLRERYWPWRRNKLYELMRHGRLPKPLKLGTGPTAPCVYPMSTVIAVQERIKAGEFADLTPVRTRRVA